MAKLDRPLDKIKDFGSTAAAFYAGGGEAYYIHRGYLTAKQAGLAMKFLATALEEMAA